MRGRRETCVGGVAVVSADDAGCIDAGSGGRGKGRAVEKSYASLGEGGADSEGVGLGVVSFGPVEGLEKRLTVLSPKTPDPTMRTEEGAIAVCSSSEYIEIYRYVLRNRVI